MLARDSRAVCDDDDNDDDRTEAKKNSLKSPQFMGFRIRCLPSASRHYNEARGKSRYTAADSKFSKGIRENNVDRHHEASVAIRFVHQLSHIDWQCLVIGSRKIASW